MNIAFWSYLTIVILGIAGWIMNIVSICNADDITGFVAVRIVGIFVAPLGAILGWF